MKIYGNVDYGIDCRIDDQVIITGDVRIGNNVHIGAGCRLFGKAGIEIHDNCSLSPGSMIFSESDTFNDISLIGPTNINREVISGKVVMMKGSAIGAGTVVMPKVTIGYYSLVGAMSLVKEDIPDYQLWAGVPARLKRLRDRDALNYHNYS